MIKKIKTEQLKHGMFVHDFNCGWLNHPFLTNSLKIEDDQTIKKVIDYGIRELYIDTDKGYDLGGAPTEDEVKHEIQAEIDRIVKPEKVNRIAGSVKEEIVKAKEIRNKAKETVHNIMEDVRFGRQIKTEEVGKVVDNMIDSIFRNDDALMSLGRIKEKDEYTYMHSVSVGVLMISFGKHLGLDMQILKEVGVGSMLHDVGKMLVSQHVLNKVEKLTEQELAMMRKHAEYSRTILEQTHGITDTAITLAAQHHERVDGTGYPFGLKGEAISYYAKAVAIADVYDAMTSKRCYQGNFLPTDVLKKLYEWSSYHYDRTLVEQFIRCVGIYPVGTLVHLESGLVGVIIQNGEKNLLQPIVRIVYNTRDGSYVRLPYEIDLAQPSGKKGEDRIVSYGSPEKLGIKPEIYL
jgi:HD-GYP domain-containing protein (c-di-GMP phosphodiesterase class II)